MWELLLRQELRQCFLDSPWPKIMPYMVEIRLQKCLCEVDFRSLWVVHYLLEDFLKSSADVVVFEIEAKTEDKSSGKGHWNSEWSLLSANTKLSTRAALVLSFFNHDTIWKSSCAANVPRSNNLPADSNFLACLCRITSIKNSSADISLSSFWLEVEAILVLEIFGFC